MSLIFIHVELKISKCCTIVQTAAKVVLVVINLDVTSCTFISKSVIGIKVGWIVYIDYRASTLPQNCKDMIKALESSSNM